jgi:hypothetical protein
VREKGLFQMKQNLNELGVRTDTDKDLPLTDPSCESNAPLVCAIFRNLVPTLIQEIRKADYVFGCVAWLTHFKILRTLAEKKGVAIVVQKEDFLRPDHNQSRGRTRILHELYAKLPGCDRWDFELLSQMSTGAEEGLSAVRCVGNHNRTKNPAHPRSHHKFVVFTRRVPCTHAPKYFAGLSSQCEDPRGPPCPLDFKPYAVWTGSFNFTNNAEHSLENAVIIYDEKIAYAYFVEFQQIAAISEPLDWESDWSAPEWRIGT